MEEAVLSLRLKRELARLPPPYIALGFDQQMTVKNRAAVTVSMGELRTLKHLAQYGRPLYVVLVGQTHMLTF